MTPDDSETGTGRVEQHVARLKLVCRFARIAVHDRDAGCARSLERLAQHRYFLRLEFHADERTASAHARGELHGFVAASAAEVEHGIAHLRLRLEQVDR